MTGSRSQGLVRTVGHGVLSGFEQRSIMIRLLLAAEWACNCGCGEAAVVVTWGRDDLDGRGGEGEKWLNSGQ